MSGFHCLVKSLYFASDPIFPSFASDPIFPSRPHFPFNVDRVLREIRQKFSLGHDVLRHTYISMTVGAFRSVGDASLQAGNSEAVIRKHYLDLKSTEEADKFWRIRPIDTELPELEKKDGRYVATE